MDLIEWEKNLMVTKSQEHEGINYLNNVLMLVEKASYFEESISYHDLQTVLEDF